MELLDSIGHEIACGRPVLHQRQRLAGDDDAFRDHQDLAREDVVRKGPGLVGNGPQVVHPHLELAPARRAHEVAVHFVARGSHRPWLDRHIPGYDVGDLGVQDRKRIVEVPGLEKVERVPTQGVPVVENRPDLERRKRDLRYVPLLRAGALLAKNRVFRNLEDPTVR